MDYQSLHGQDISNFSPPSSHRMPTVSAAQALQDLRSPSTRCISTGLRGLDCALLNPDLPPLDAPPQYGGVARGQVTEMYGPPGAGKTALGIQLATSALHAGQKVVWVDAAHPLPGPRLTEVLSSSRPQYDQNNASSPASPPTTADILKNLIHFTTPTLPHLIALICHTTPSFPPPNTSLIIIDSLSTLIASAYPRTLDSTSTPRIPASAPKNDPQNWATARKWPILQFLISSFQKLATLQHLAIVILTQSITKMQSGGGGGAMLVPAISSTAWDVGIATNIVLFRDWGWEGRQVRFARILKVDGVLVTSKGGVEAGRAVAFTIESHGLQEVQLPDLDTAAGILDPSIIAAPSRKRKADEIRDSEEEDGLEGSDEDYGWAEEDELPLPPPQWQGSEDILVPGTEERDEKDEEEEEEEAEETAETGANDEVGDGGELSLQEAL